MNELPEYYFRIRENGAFVFRVNPENRQRRLEMDQIAAVNVRNGEVKPHGGRTLSDADRQVIDEWMEERRAELARREMSDVQQTVERLNLTAHWAQTKATDDQLEQVTGDLLMAMHDLRAVLVRKAADRLDKAGTA
ncbi:hypothetical protein [Tranquillimonas alkanivorans]|uniref:Uncharacterized protein n=1 Tax=Tranquillimonas alkanivorans TaxID=441119 RepID=A0A1I5KG00_9RHOB|nr:hypothetical protein SAMN04488047_10184 [Tranquillimonas alkanivorans]